MDPSADMEQEPGGKNDLKTKLSLFGTETKIPAKLEHHKTKLGKQKNTEEITKPECNISQELMAKTKDNNDEDLTKSAENREFKYRGG